jgi:hypothetical protein
LAAFLKAIGYLIPLMDAEYASYYTTEVMLILIREFVSPDEEMKKIVLKVSSFYLFIYIVNINLVFRLSSNVVQLMVWSRNTFVTKFFRTFSEPSGTIEWLWTVEITSSWSILQWRLLKRLAISLYESININ